MKKFNLIFLSLLLGLSLASCTNNEVNSSDTTKTESTTPESGSTTPESESTKSESTKPETESTKTTGPVNPVELSYSLEVVDIDGEVILDTVVESDSSKTLFDDLQAYDVKYDTYDSFHAITSISGSIVDKNYYLALYQNGSYSKDGVDSIKINNNDEIKFVSETFNEGFDELDIRLDKVIYSFIKNAKEMFKGLPADYNLLAALGRLRELGYDVADDIFTSEQIADLNGDLNTMSEGSMIKYVTASKYLKRDLKPIKDVLEKRVVAPKKGGYSEYSTVLYYLAAKMVGATLPNEDLYLDYFNTQAMSKGDTGVLLALGLQKAKPNYDKNIFIDMQKKTFTKDGVDAGFGVSGTSTGLMLLGFSALGIDIRNENLKIDGKDLIEILFDNYLVDGNKLSNYIKGDADLMFATPQGMAGLISYKIGRDLGSDLKMDFTNGEIFF